MRTKLVAGNWKMNMSYAQLAAYIESVVALLDAKTSVDVLICPAFVHLHRLNELLRNTHLQVGAQDVFWMSSGAFTGRISPTMLVEAGVTYCIVGHSETRGRFGVNEVPASAVRHFAETDETVNLKIKALLFHGIAPILCVGETAAERAEGRTEDVVAAQLARALDGIDAVELGRLAVAYEPVWAIGTGQTCDAAEADRVCGLLRAELARHGGDEFANTARVLYGGSVKAANSGELFAQPNIDGGLIGGASLDPQEFCRIVISA
jgi:triosephosphate isomerase